MQLAGIVVDLGNVAYRGRFGIKVVREKEMHVETKEQDADDGPDNDDAST